MKKFVQNFQFGDSEKNRDPMLAVLIQLEANMTKTPFKNETKSKHRQEERVQEEQGEPAMPVLEEEVVKYKRQRCGEWGIDQQGQAIPMSSSAMVVYKERLEAMKVAAHLSLEAKKAVDKHMLEAKQAEDKHMLELKQAEDKHMLEVKQAEDKHMLEVKQAEDKHMLEVKQAEDKRIESAGRALLKMRVDEDEHVFTTRERLHNQAITHAKERMALESSSIPTAATAATAAPIAPAPAAEAENPDLSTTVLKEYIKMQSQFNFKNDAEKKAVLSSAGIITANKFRAKWGFSPEQRLEGEYGAVNFYPVVEGAMIIDSLRDAIRKVRGKGLQPALCFLRVA